MKQLAKKATYWNGNGTYSNHYEHIQSALVPSAGKCETFEGELLRAAGRIYYDLYNNGFCNNWTGAWNFLSNANDLHSLGIASYLHDLFAYRCGAYPAEIYPDLYVAVERIVDQVLSFILSHNGNYSPNSVDMFDFQEPVEYQEPEESEWYDDEYYD